MKGWDQRTLRGWAVLAVLALSGWLLLRIGIAHQSGASIAIGASLGAGGLGLLAWLAEDLRTGGRR